MLAAGKLDQRLTFQSPSSSVDSHGQRVETWTDFVTVWGSAQPIRGREFFAAGQMQSEASVRFVIRWRSGITGTMRVLWRGVPHAIVAEPMDVDGQRVSLEVMAAAGIRDSA